MDHPARTAAFRVLQESRRSDLQRTFATIFAEPKPVVLEVGSGHGHFLTAYAAAHPEKCCVGVDLAGDRVERAVRKRDRAGLSNLFFIQADVRLFLAALPAEIRMAEIFVLFPDPWPKLRHRKHRIIQPAFLSAASALAAPDCRFAFRTDHEPYYRDAHATIAAHPAWQLVEEKWPFEFETVFQSRAASHFSLLARHRANCAVISATEQKNAHAN